MASRLLSLRQKNSLTAFRRSVLSRSYTIDAKKHGFVLSQKSAIPEIDVELLRFKHEKTGADYLHAQCDDTNNVFSIGFSTPPTNDKGVPHILEHTTLCGSQKFPIRDPFFKMLNRSLSNFMNAFTASDFTFYPFATTNKNDFKNLRSVYLDATLHPRLRKADFMQEGWRYVLNKSDQDLPISYNGVVFNEMKGQMSDASYLFYIRFQKHLAKGTIYEHNSGGDPYCIPDLSYEELVAFHDSHYHPSNAKIFTYGNLSLDENLSALNEAFSQYSKETLKPEVKYIPNFAAPRRVTEHCPIDPTIPQDKQAKFSISFLGNDICDQEETFSLQVLSKLLTDGYSSPMYKALIESGLATDYSPNTGYDSTMKRSVFSIGVEGVSTDKLETIEKTILSTFDKVASEGIAFDKVEAVLHQLEISLKHKSANFGMGLAQSIPYVWFNEGDPIDALSFNKRISSFRKKANDPTFLTGLVQKYMLGNSNRLIFTMLPDEQYQADVQAKEQNKLKEAASKMSKKELQNIEKTNMELQKDQEQTGDINCLPTLKVSDIPLQQEPTILDFDKVQNHEVQWSKIPAGLTYLRVFIPCMHLPDTLVPYLNLFSDACLSLGTKDMNISELEQQIKRYTGGITVSPTFSTAPTSRALGQFGISISSFCLDSHVEQTMSLIRKVFFETDFYHTKNLSTMLKTMANGLLNSVAERGHVFARTNAASSLTVKAALAEQLGGIEHLQLVHKLSNKTPDELTDLSKKFDDIRHFLSPLKNARLFVSCSQQQRPIVASFIPKFTDASQRLMSSANESSAAQTTSRKPAHTYYVLPYFTHYTSRSLLGVPYAHEDGAALQLLSSLLTHKFLHREIREKGGAYGGGLTYNGLDGLLSFYSYRDDNPLQSFEAFQEAGKWASQNSFSESDLNEAKLSTFQSVDAPVSISAKGSLFFYDRVTDAMRQKRREQLLSVTKAAVQRAANEYLLSENKSSEPSHYDVILGPENKKLDATWTTIIPF
ncbi:metalloendopeptidase [Schizosaccharomyces japonicus yFS275]|uniref:Presequence protease, mitochondrial n=1 Tax=Schizosaccharomyces japonicus (strain yFS275 / FY16936) TaxID=402676 RepID=B6K729_SCHJY|nr:metalloendopeptidase [Schizosaccharomyces japonicus yFS275]EEB09333.1 metalloendopeptidase [Schizosaccharomyces japonicus yFS275]